MVAQQQGPPTGLDDFYEGGANLPRTYRTPLPSKPTMGSSTGRKRPYNRAIYDLEVANRRGIADADRNRLRFLADLTRNKTRGLSALERSQTRGRTDLGTSLERFKENNAISDRLLPIRREQSYLASRRAAPRATGRRRQAMKDWQTVYAAQQEADELLRSRFIDDNELARGRLDEDITTRRTMLNEDTGRQKGRYNIDYIRNRDRRKEDYDLRRSRLIEDRDRPLSTNTNPYHGFF